MALKQIGNNTLPLSNIFYRPTPHPVIPPHDDNSLDCKPRLAYTPFSQYLTSQILNNYKN